MNILLRQAKKLMDSKQEVLISENGQKHIGKIIEIEDEWIVLEEKNSSITVKVSYIDKIESYVGQNNREIRNENQIFSEVEVRQGDTSFRATTTESGTGKEIMEKSFILFNNLMEINLGQTRRPLSIPLAQKSGNDHSIAPYKPDQEPAKLPNGNKDVKTSKTGEKRSKQKRLKFKNEWTDAAYKIAPKDKFNEILETKNSTEQSLFGLYILKEVSDLTDISSNVIQQILEKAYKLSIAEKTIRTNLQNEDGKRVIKKSPTFFEIKPAGEKAIKEMFNNSWIQPPANDQQTS